MALLDLLGRRWSLRVLWELRDGPLKARALRSRCDDASPASLNVRLSELRRADLVIAEKGVGYRLTARGRELVQLFLPVNAFADRWADRASNCPNDPAS